MEIGLQETLTIYGWNVPVQQHVNPLQVRASRTDNLACFTTSLVKKKPILHVICRKIKLYITTKRIKQNKVYQRTLRSTTQASTQHNITSSPAWRMLTYKQKQAARRMRKQCCQHSYVALKHSEY
jgi:hypothetical protein